MAFRKFLVACLATVSVVVLTGGGAGFVLAPIPPGTDTMLVADGNGSTGGSGGLNPLPTSGT